MDLKAASVGWHRCFDAIREMLCRYAASIIGLIALCLLQESVSRLRTNIARHYSIKNDSVDAENTAVVHPEIGSPPSFGRWVPEYLSIIPYFHALYGLKL